jgi:hypothetical protein
MKQTLLHLSKRALLEGARKASPIVAYDENGYAPRWEENLMNGLPLVEIKSDLEKGAGSELKGKLRAAHSSAALVVNAFGPWRTVPDSLGLAGLRGFSAVHFEFPRPTGLGRTPPHLDLLADGDLPVAVESKCTEWMQSKPAIFSVSYDNLRASYGNSPWFEQMQQLRDAADRYRFLDAAQLIKHAFGLMACYGMDHQVRLLYLYWEPRNAEKWVECRLHRAEADDLAAKVERSAIRLVPMSYRELWAEWGGDDPSDHLRYLVARYDLEVV